MRPIDAHLAAEQIKNSDLANHWKNALLSCLSSIPTISPPPNDPLTLEELREMERGSSIWIFYLGHGANALINSIDEKAIDVKTVFQDFKMLLEDYGKFWSAYRRKPEEGAK